jgi:Lipid A 3-O-deacylase (PagL)
MRSTPPRRIAWACLLLLLSCWRVHAQQSPSAPAEPFAVHRWHYEASFLGAPEVWTRNESREQLYGLAQGLSYGVREWLLLRMDQHVYYVSQREADSWLFGLTVGLRGRIYRRERSSVFIDAAVGISDSTVATPPRGTRFNFLAVGAVGLLVHLRPRVHALAALQLLHVSNGGLKGPERNPDIEAFGPRVGLVVGF